MLRWLPLVQEGDDDAAEGDAMHEVGGASMCIYECMYIYIYIYLSLSLSPSLSLSIYIYIFMRGPQGLSGTWQMTLLAASGAPPLLI